MQSDDNVPLSVPKLFGFRAFQIIHLLSLALQKACFLLDRGAIERTDIAIQKKRFFYSTYFLLQNKDCSCRPILDLKELNWFLKALWFQPSQYSGFFFFYVVRRLVHVNRSALMLFEDFIPRAGTLIWIIPTLWPLSSTMSLLHPHQGAGHLGYACPLCIYYDAQSHNELGKKAP